MSRVLLRLSALLLPLLAVAMYVAPSAPTDVMLPGTQPLEAPTPSPAVDCFACHASYDAAVEPGRNWQGSMMAHAARDPLFWGAMAVAEQDFDGSGDLCLRCHSPSGWIGGRSTPTDGSMLNAATDADGVSCDVCHRMTNPDWTEHFGVQYEPFLAHEDGTPPKGYFGAGMYTTLFDNFNKVGPYDDAVTPHGFLQSQFHRDSRLCGTCHDVSNPVTGDLAHNNGAQVPLAPGSFSDVLGGPVEDKAAFNNFPHEYGVVERTFSEHQASAFSDMVVSSYTALPAELQAGSLQTAFDAAMASTVDGNYVDGAVRTFSCQTCHMRPVLGEGCLLSPPVRSDLPLHDLTGGNYWTPEAIAWMDGQGTLPFGGGLSAVALSAMSDGADRARDNLEDSASLEVYGETLRVVNLTGHKLISGYPEGRRMWLSVEWKDAGGATLRHDGEYGPLTVDIGGTPTVVESIVDLADPHLVEFTTHHAITQEWAADLLGLGTDPALPVAYDRVTGAATLTLGALAAQAPGTHAESFHFVLNNTQVSDTRIPPYGYAYDEARTRNALPVPDTQYGNPGPGGIYRHWAEVTLDPPVDAVSADIELLYQPTSWEYLQFLHLANDGSISNLAAVGDDLLDAWLATGMAAPHIMASTTWTAGASVSPWTDQGNALAGTNGLPTLTGAGPLNGGESVSFAFENALPGGNLFLVLGVGLLNAPFKGGTMVPTPDVVVGAVPVGPAGSFHWMFTWPVGAVSGLPIHLQGWIQDAGGPVGWAATNGLTATTP